MRLYKTNDVGDPGVEVEPSAIAEAFWSSPIGDEWRDESRDMNLERTAMRYVLETFGTWLNRDEWDTIYDAIHERMSRHD